MSGMMPGYGDFPWFGGIIMVLFWVLVIVGIIALIKGLIYYKPIAEDQSEETALEILKRRYAQGEITKRDFEDKKRYLGL